MNRYALLILTALFLLAAACGNQDRRAPSVPPELSVINPREDSLTVLWNSATDFSGISLYKVNRNGMDYLETESLGFVDGGLDPATLYCYHVRAVDPSGNISDYSPRVCGTTLPVSLPPIVVSDTAGILNSTFNDGILNTSFFNTTIEASAFINSALVNSTLADCVIINSTIFNSPLFGNTVSGLTIINATINNSPGAW